MSIMGQLREAIRESGISVYRIAKDTGIPQPSVQRFAAGDRGLSMENLDTLADYLGLELKPRKAKGKKP